MTSHIGSHVMYVKVGPKKDPQGYYVAVTTRDVFERYVRNRFVSLNVVIEEIGEEVFIKSKSRSILKRLIKFLASKGVTVIGSI